MNEDKNENESNQPDNNRIGRAERTKIAEGKTTLTVEAGEVVLPASAPVKLGVMTRRKAIVGDTKVYEHGEPSPGLMFYIY